MIINSNCQGLYIDEVVPNLMVLLYADDLVQCADLPGRLQSQLNVLADFCEKWGMKVNFDKTNVMVFRNGGIIKINELWYFKGQQLRPATYYKYRWHSSDVLIIMLTGWTPKLLWLCLTEQSPRCCCMAPKYGVIQWLNLLKKYRLPFASWYLGLAKQQIM